MPCVSFGKKNPCTLDRSLAIAGMSGLETAPAAKKSEMKNEDHQILVSA